MEDKTNFWNSSSQDNSSDEQGLMESKYASYFSTMSPLAARIYEDIHKVETKCENFGSLSYDEKCSVIDKHLLFNNGSSKTNNGDEEVISHTAAMLMAVCPRKTPTAEDNNNADNNIDDISHLTRKYSGRFSSHSESEIGACRLGDMLKKVTLLTKKKKQRSTSMNKKMKNKAPLPKPTTTTSLSRSSTESYDMMTITMTANQPPTMEDKRHSISSSYYQEDEEDQLKKYEGYKPNKPYSAAAATAKMSSSLNKKPEIQDYDVDDDNDDGEDDRLPQQKQNLDLIAELQAKLKRNKSSANGGGQCGNSPVLKHHILKPKAPPPPPPPQKTKDVGKNINEKKEPDTLKKKNSDDENRDEFLVDVSSPCRIATPKTGFDFLDNW